MLSTQLRAARFCGIKYSHRFDIVILIASRIIIYARPFPILHLALLLLLLLLLLPVHIQDSFLLPQFFNYSKCLLRRICLCYVCVCLLACLCAHSHTLLLQLHYSPFFLLRSRLIFSHSFTFHLWVYLLERDKSYLNITIVLCFVLSHSTNIFIFVSLSFPYTIHVLCLCLVCVCCLDLINHVFVLVFRIKTKAEAHNRQRDYIKYHRISHIV